MRIMDAAIKADHICFSENSRQRSEIVQADIDCRGTSRQVDNHALSARSGGLPGENGGRHLFEADPAYQFVKPFQFARPSAFLLGSDRAAPAGAAGGSGLGRPLHLTSRSAPAPRFRYPAKEIVDRLPADILIFAAAGAIGYCQHADPASRLSGISALLQKRRFQHRQPCERFLGMATNHSDRFGEPRIVVFSIEAFGIVKRRQFESEIAQQPIPQAVDPTVNGNGLLALPGAANNWRGGDRRS